MLSHDLVFYVQFQVKPEHIQDWQTAVMEVIDHMAKEDTFVTCYLHQDTQDPSRFTLYERWRKPSVEAFVQNQLEAKSYRKAYEEKLPDWLDAPRTASVLSYIKEWHADMQSNFSPSSTGDLQRINGIGNNTQS